MNQITKSINAYQEYIENKEDVILELRNMLNIDLIKTDLFLQAITCSAFAKEYNDAKKDMIQDHKGLATFGDAVLNTIICEKGFNRNPKISKALLTHEKEIYVNNETLNEIGYDMRIDRVLFHRNHDMMGKKTLATTLEAIIGALYLSNGYEAAKSFVHNFIIKQD